MKKEQLNAATRQNATIDINDETATSATTVPKVRNLYKAEVADRIGITSRYR
jgi:hypothetical protein